VPLGTTCARRHLSAAPTTRRRRRWAVAPRQRPGAVLAARRQRRTAAGPGSWSPAGALRLHCSRARACRRIRTRGGLRSSLACVRAKSRTGPGWMRRVLVSRSVADMMPTAGSTAKGLTARACPGRPRPGVHTVPSSPSDRRRRHGARQCLHVLRSVLPAKE
jgi:hypothetical protein